jgi:hypothetical protein
MELKIFNSHSKLFAMFAMASDNGSNMVAVWPIDRLAFPGGNPLPPFSDLSKSELWRGLYSLSESVMEGVRERRDYYVRKIRWDVTWPAHCDEAIREELALVIWQDYSDAVNRNVAF